MSARTGQCLCGAVQVAITDAPHEAGACHCTMCRRWTGSAFVTLAVPEDKMTVVGSDAIATYASSPWAGRHFCARCGSTLWYRLTGEGMPRDYYMALGLLDDPNGIRLAHEIYIDFKPDGYAFAGPTHQMTGAEFEASVAASTKE